jgi:hypothetical protein
LQKSPKDRRVVVPLPKQSSPQKSESKNATMEMFSLDVGDAVNCNPFYDQLILDTMNCPNRNVCTAAYVFVDADGTSKIDTQLYDEWSKKVTAMSGKIPTLITKNLAKLFHTKKEKANFAFAKIQPWENSQQGKCYTNTKAYCKEHPEYEPICVFAIYDQEAYYELEHHSLVQHKKTKVFLDITPTLEVVLGMPSLKKICFVSHPMVQQIRNMGVRRQYGIIVLK